MVVPIITSSLGGATTSCFGNILRKTGGKIIIKLKTIIPKIDKSQFITVKFLFSFISIPLF